MHANLPVIANRWEKKYGLGGVAELNAELNSLPEYYLPFPAAQGGRIGFEQGSGPMTFKEYFKGKSKFEIDKTREDMIREYEEYLFRQKYGPQDRPNVAQGGLIPAHQAGIYGLAEGGRIGFKTRGFVQPRPDGQRPGYTEDEEDTGDVAVQSVSDVSYGSTDDNSSDQSNEFNMTSTQTTSPSTGRGRNMLGDYDPNNTTNWQEKGLHIDSRGNETNPVDRGEMSQTEYNLVLQKKGTTGDNGDARSKYLANLHKTPLTALQNTRKYDRLQTKIDERNKQKKQDDIRGIISLISGGVNPFSFGKYIYDHNKKTKSFIKEIDADIKRLTDMGYPIHSPHGKGTLIQQLEQQKLNLTQRRPKQGSQDEGPPGPKLPPTIAKTLEPRYQTMRKASTLAQTSQEELRNKQMAYWREMMEPYMSAKGGRVPGYNTGGLSNLFRLKTA